MLALFAIVGSMFCYVVYIGLSFYFFKEPPTEIGRCEAPPDTITAPRLTREEFDLMRAYDLI